MATAYDHANLRGARNPTGTNPDGTPAGGTRMRFLLSGTEEVADIEVNPATGARTVTRRYVPGAAIDERLAEINAQTGAVYFLHTDRQNSVVAISDAAGNPVARRGYGAYGETNPAQMTGAGASSHPFGYTGRRWDPDLQLYYYRARWYDPELGTFLQTDPIGAKDYINLYSYVGLQPGNATDPSGMARVCTERSGSRVQSCVMVDGDCDVSDQDLTFSQRRSFGQRFSQVICNNAGRNISADGKEVTGYGGTVADRTIVRVTSQFVGAAIRTTGDRGLKEAWSRVSRIQMNVSHNPRTSGVAYAEPEPFSGQVPGREAARTSAYSAQSFAIKFNPTRTVNGRDLYSSPGNLARILIHETMHGQFPTLGPREHHDLDARARAFTFRAGLYSGAGGIWAIGGFPGGC